MHPKTRVRRWRQCELCTAVLGPNGPVYDPRVPDALLCEMCVSTREDMTAKEIVKAIG
jgi:hypothetical protein